MILSKYKDGISISKIHFFVDRSNELSCLQTEFEDGEKTEKMGNNNSPDSFIEIPKGKKVEKVKIWHTQSYLKAIMLYDSKGDAIGQINPNHATSQFSCEEYTINDAAQFGGFYGYYNQYVETIGVI